MKVIFLDNDGVICLSNNWGSRGKKRKKFSEDSVRFNVLDMPVEVRFDDFDKGAIEVLNRILEKTGTEVVVSSDWRLYGTLEELGDYYLSQGISKRPIGFTPILDEFDESTAQLLRWRGSTGRARSLEIKKWLEDNKVEKWVAVDDLDMSNEYLQPGLDNFVLTPRSYEGIKQTGVYEKILKFL
jgi:hypothetical protein